MTDEEVLNTYGNMVYRVAYSFTKNSFDADDIYSETFLRYFRRPWVFADEEHRKAWLLRVTVNCAKSFWRKNRGMADLDSLPLSDGGKERDQTDERLTMQQAIESLDPAMATAVYLFYYEQLPIAQIAQALDISEGAVKMRLKRARDKLKKALAPQ